MSFNIRYLSLLLRRRHSHRECLRTLRSYEEWRETLRTLHAPTPQPGTLLVIRLDDIGDYLLFRNQLSMYKRSARWDTHSITLLGNAAWQDLFCAFDGDTVDDTIWVDKAEYLTSAAYRSQIWRRLRDHGFETVIAPSRTRPLLLDDLCRLAAAPLHSIGCVNTHVHAGWNEISDGLYHELFEPSDAWLHEFHFNGRFAAWVCAGHYGGNRPVIGSPEPPTVESAGDGASGGSGAASNASGDPGTSVGPGAGKPAGGASELICFVGANTRSRRWPAKRWIEFIRLYRRSHAGRVVLAGSGAAEREIAALIEAQTDAESLVGKVSLLELVERIRGAAAVLSNDTMAVHLSVSCGRPTIIVANGVNHERFTDYEAAGIAGVATLYPRVFTRRLAREPRLLHRYADALTADIASISAVDVLARLEDVVRTSGSTARA